MREATVHFGASMVEELNKKVELIRNARPYPVKPELIKAVYTMISVGDANRNPGNKA